MNERSDGRTAAWLALLLYGIYLLSFSGRFYSQDSMLMFSVTESFVKRGEFNADQMWTIYKARNELGPDGESYSKTGYGTSLLAAPLYAVARVVPGIGLVQTTLLSSAIAIALAGALVFLSARRMGYASNVSILLALLFGLATPAWVYAKQLWSEPFGLVTLFAAFYFLLRYRGEGRAWDAVFAGIALGLAVAVRVSNAAVVPFFALYGFGRAWKEPRARVGLVLFGAVLALAALSIGWYDWVRYGNPLNTGYRADEGFNNPILLGLYGLLFSPGKGLFIYIPFLAVLPWSLFQTLRRNRAELLVSLAVIGVYVVTFSTWYYWWGGTNWAARFLVPILPFLVLVAAPAAELALAKLDETASLAHLSFKSVFAALCLLSVAIELLGISIPALSYRLRMVRLSPNPEGDAIFQPGSSPLIGYFDLIRPRVLDFAWIRYSGDGIAIDWIALTLSALFVVGCGVLLVLHLRGKPRVSAPILLPLMAFDVALVLSFVVLLRYADDVRFGGGDGYKALLETVAREEQAGDVLVLNNDIYQPFIMNENRADLRWYGLSRDPQQWDAATQALLDRLARDYRRIWFALDDTTAELDDPTRDWLDQKLEPIVQQDLADGVHLVLYVTGTKP